MSWSVKITILYLGFVAMILTLVFMCMNQSVDLVSKDYYAQELVYQKRIDATNNEKKLAETVQYEINQDRITIKFPSELHANGNVNGKILFYRPSDPKLDVEFPITLDATGKQVISSGRLKKGVYKMQLSWISGSTEYFKEEVIFIN